MKRNISPHAIYVASLLFIGAGFATDFTTPLPGRIESLALDANGQYLVGHHYGITRVRKDGSIDRTVESTPSRSLLAVENEGTVLAREFTRLVRIGLDGSTNFNVVDLFRSAVLQPNGNVLVLGTNSLSRILPDGNPDSSFTPAPLQGGTTTSLALQEDGKVIVAGAQGGAIFRFESNGAPDPTFSAPTLSPPWMHTVAVQPDGRILLGGDFYTLDGSQYLGLARLNANGSLDSSFQTDSNLMTVVHSFALQSDGKIVVAGTFYPFDGGSTTKVARLLANGSEDPTFPSTVVPAPFNSLPLTLTVEGSILVGSRTNLIRIPNPTPATQSFSRDGSTLTWLRGSSSPEIYNARFQASLDGSSWTDLGSGTRIPGGWQLQNANIPEGAHLRVRGYITGASYHIDVSTALRLTHQQLHGNALTLNASTSSPHPRLILQTSTDLHQWADLQTNLTTSSLHFTLTNQTAPRAFYRLRSENQ
ncbi:MAG TPA: delta-60 repeat domain-containing protein [Verrucomicrobiae bacterium]